MKFLSYLTPIGVAISSFILSPAQANAELMINEIMQSNIDCIMDNFNEFPDSWVEIYNPGDTKVSLSGYSIGITDDPTQSFAFHPSHSIEPRGYYVMYCDKNRNAWLQHTDFRLESGKGCAIYLFKKNEVVDYIKDLKKQPSPNIAYGRETDGVSKWGYQITATPGKANCGSIAKELLPDPIFSHPGAISPTPFKLTLSLPEGAPANAIIRFTLDGSEPTADSQKYSEPIDISRTTVVRAKLFADSHLLSRSIAQSYIFHPRTQTMPIVSITIDPEYLYGEEIGIFSDYKFPIYGGNPNWNTDIRRPANIEFFFEDKPSASINQLIEIRIKGETSRALPLKSLAIYANKRFGVKRFAYEIFPDQKPGISEFKSLELRNGGGDAHRLVMRDAVIQRLMGENTDIDWQAYRPSVVYLNGNYYGMLNIRERSNEDNIEANYDGLEDIDMIENWDTVKTGSIESFHDFRSFFSVPGHSLDEFRSKMDIENFITHTIAYLFFANTDYPNNNFIMWRPQSADGRWRFILKDLDNGLGLNLKPDFDIFDWFYNPQKYPTCNWANTPESTLLLRTLLEIPEFKKEFIDRMAVYTGDFLTSENIITMIDNMADKIEGEVYASHAKNSPEWSDFDYFLSKIKEWIPLRWEYMQKNLSASFNLGKPVALTISAVTDNNISFSINGIPVKNNEFNGYHFAGNKICIEGINYDSSEKIVGWIYRETLTNGSTKVLRHSTPAFSFTMPDTTSITLIPITEDSGIEEIYDSIGNGIIDFDMPYEVYTLTGYNAGNDVSNLDKGIYLIRQGDKTLKYKF